MKQLIEAIEKVNYYEAAEGQAYAREGGARRRAYLNLIEVAREHSDAEIEEALDEVGVILFNEDLLIGKTNSTVAPSTTGTQAYEDLLVGKSADEINTNITVGCPAGGTQLNGGEK